MAQHPVGERTRLTLRRLSGLDRSGPPPPQTLRGEPWNPWTVPNAIGFVRLALIPVFLVMALGAEEGVPAFAAILFAVMRALSRIALAHDLDIRINWLGRAAVWPVMSALPFAMIGVQWLAEPLLYLGIVLVLASTAQYVRDARARLSSST